MRPSNIVPQVELLRVIAVAGVFLFHLWSVAPAAGGGAIGAWLGGVLSYGTLGVVLFNVITGFVLALPHLGGQQRPLPAYPDFLRRRLGRICPQYYLALLLWTAVAVVAGGLTAPLIGSFLAHLLFVHTLSPATFFSIVPAFWWLGLLAQFYLLFPLVLRLFRHLSALHAWMLVSAACWALWYLLFLAGQARPGSVWALLHYMWYFNLPARLPELAFGIWLAAVWGRSPQASSDTIALRGQAALVTGMAGLLALAGLWLSPGSQVLQHVHAVAWCWLLIMALFTLPLLARLGRARAVARVAAVSYGIYLMHQPVLGYLSNWLEPRLGETGLFLLLLIAGAALAYALGWALERSAAALTARWRAPAAVER
jgi:peptidoglycan/LPS O-acetylase OafA/YrhL